MKTGENRKRSLTEVYSVQGEAQACLFKEFLVNNGIPAIVISESINGLSFFTTGTFAKAKILVPEKMAEKARALIAEVSIS
jgi:hypothetical protein